MRQLAAAGAVALVLPIVAWRAVSAEPQDLPPPPCDPTHDHDGRHRDADGGVRRGAPGAGAAADDPAASTTTTLPVDPNTTTTTIDPSATTTTTIDPTATTTTAIVDPNATSTTTTPVPVDPNATAPAAVPVVRRRSECRRRHHDCACRR